MVEKIEIPEERIQYLVKTTKVDMVTKYKTRDGKVFYKLPQAEGHEKDIDLTDYLNSKYHIALDGWDTGI